LKSGFREIIRGGHSTAKGRAEGEGLCSFSSSFG
jgi:hypothetical protein